MEAQAAQIQKKLQVELDNFKATQKGELMRKFIPSRLNNEPNVFLIFLIS